MAQEGDLEALRAQVEALRVELETRRRGEPPPRDRAITREIPQRRGRCRDRAGTRWASRCFRCSGTGHYARDCAQDPDPAFPSWRYGPDRWGNWGAGPARKLPTIP
jgi:hypothetical protein